MFPTMAAAASLVLTLEEIKIFHAMDRKLYSFLAIDSWRDPLDSMRVMAFWLWLERFGFHNVVSNISMLSDNLIIEIADEAMACIAFLGTSDPFNSSSEHISIPLTRSILGNKLPRNFFAENRAIAVLGIARALTDVCLRAFSDLMHQAVERNNARSLLETQIAMSSFIEPGFSRLSLGASSSNIFDDRRPEDEVAAVAAVVHPDDRTMFVTFSKGYPVPERDIREFFTVMYGDCIEALHMQEVQAGEQSLYARIVFYTPSVIDVILNGVEKAKFTIKGRHMWMRKFVPKRRRAVSPPRRAVSPPRRAVSPPGTLMLRRPGMPGGSGAGSSFSGPFM